MECSEIFILPNKKSADPTLTGIVRRSAFLLRQHLVETAQVKGENSIKIIDKLLSLRKSLYRNGFD